MLATGLAVCDMSVRSADATPAPTSGAVESSGISVSAKAWDTLQRRRVYFAHQSVGYNLLDGVRELAAAQPGVHVNIVESRAPSTVNGPGIVHFAVGKNRDPASKNRDFLAFLDSRPVPDSAIVVLKYCYVDMTPLTDVPKLFADYQIMAAEARGRHPELTFVHATMPLTTAEPTYKAIAKRMMGREVRRDLDVKRNAYNALIRRAYSRHEPVFDLADAESTLPDGARTFFMADKDTVFTLAEQYSADSGHLNDLGKRRVAAAMLEALGSVQT
jgi:hypothetical protein